MDAMIRDHFHNAKLFKPWVRYKMSPLFSPVFTGGFPNSTPGRKKDDAKMYVEGELVQPNEWVPMGDRFEA